MILTAENAREAVRKINILQAVIVQCVELGYSDTAKLYSMILGRFVRRTIGW